jgi:hypothetical protein
VDKNWSRSGCDSQFAERLGVGSSEGVCIFSSYSEKMHTPEVESRKSRDEVVRRLSAQAAKLVPLGKDLAYSVCETNNRIDERNADSSGEKA